MKEADAKEIRIEGKDKNVIFVIIQSNTYIYDYDNVILNFKFPRFYFAGKVPCKKTFKMSNFPFSKGRPENFYPEFLLKRTVK